MTHTASGTTRKRTPAAAKSPGIAQLEARVADLRAHSEKTAAAVARAAEWATEQNTNCSYDNLREAKFEHTLAKNGLARAERLLEEARKGGAAK